MCVCVWGGGGVRRKHQSATFLLDLGRVGWGLEGSIMDVTSACDHIFCVGGSWGGGGGSNKV